MPPYQLRFNGSNSSAIKIPAAKIIDFYGNAVRLNQVRLIQMFSKTSKPRTLPAKLALMRLEYSAYRFRQDLPWGMFQHTQPDGNVHFEADQKDERVVPEPNHKCNQGSDGAIYLVVIQKVVY